MSNCFIVGFVAVVACFEFRVEENVIFEDYSCDFSGMQDGSCR